MCQFKSGSVRRVDVQVNFTNYNYKPTTPNGPPLQLIIVSQVPCPENQFAISITFVVNFAGCVIFKDT